MLKRGYPELLLVLCGAVATGIGWLLVRNGATPNDRVAVAQALRHAQPADIESITVYPLQPGQSRPFEVRAPAALRPLLPALQQLRPVVLAPNFEPLLEATLQVRLQPGLAAAQHLHSRTITFRLATSAEGEVAQLAQTNYFYHAAALSKRIWQLRDSLAARR
ncbi:hypothetical protein GKZ68_09425 [Hymenobacter sp. BRD128]|uniref:hypothetical protein n=1 Tax=Hymenobacter sp. BRD128 TaxID=2675878 RepID=UPI001566C18F|nr:hypothetical protein [Hymenobacter sp. BRD128]QKG56822.1 hypothetical protein GKZ68_09425 [Hymenobacter sp. BRD128]